MIPRVINRTTLAIFFMILMSLAFFTITTADAGGYPWKYHAPPYNFKLGNNIDTYQQTQIKASGELLGFLYITPIEGAAGIEEIDGVPVVEHCDSNTPPDKCEVGWIIRGKFVEGDNRPTFVYQNNDHPVWFVNSRNDIPQPGSFSHFHWIGLPESADGLNGYEGVTFAGYFLELYAVDHFYFRHNGEDLLVMPGVDIATHVNIIGSIPEP